MENFITETVKLELDNGHSILAEVRNKNRQQVSNPTYSFEKVSLQLKEISKKIITSFEEAKPNKVSVELGFELSIESGQLTAILVKGSSKANLKIILEWDNNK